MLDFMRSQAQGWIVKVLFAVIVMSFALWGVGDYFSGQQAVTVATVGDQQITQQSLQRRMRSERNRLRRILGENFDPERFSNERIQARALDQLIRRRLIDLEVQRLGLTVPDAVVQQAIRSESAFRQGGSFSQQRYRSLLDRMGLGPSEYESRMREDLAAEGLRRFIQRATIVSDHEVWKAFRRRQEERTVRYFRMKPSRLAGEVELTAKAVRTFYKDHPDRYRRPPQARVRFVVLSPEAVAGRFEPSTDQLRAYLEDHADRYRQEGEDMPALEGIRDQVAADWRSDRAADWIFERLPTFKDLLYTRDDLTTLSEEFGLRIRTSDWIPETGEMPPGVPDSEKFRKAAFSVDTGSNSRAIELGDARFTGLHVLERRSASVRPFEAVRDRVRKDLRRVRALELATKRARAARDALEEGRSLEELAREHGAEVAKAGPAARRKARAEWPSGLASAVFGVEEGGTGVVSLASRERAVFEVTEVSPPKRSELTQSQRTDIQSRLRRARGRARMEAFFQHLRERYEVRVRKPFRTSSG